MGEKSIAKAVDEILQERHEKVPKVERVIRNIGSAITVAEKLSILKRNLVDENGELREDSEYYDLFAGNPETVMRINVLNPQNFIDKAKALVESYKEIRERFSREYINIAAVGKARQGKSKFLQAISGLDSRCIPAFDSGHCTGAKSTIENSENKTVMVEITFKNEKEIVDEANEYFELVTGDKRYVRNFSEFMAITPEDVDKLYQGKKTGSKIVNKMLLFKKRYIEKQARDEWCGLIGSEIPPLTDENVIMEYVAQYNGKKEGDPERKDYFKFVAVKSARIYKAFEYEDAGKIKMIDTVGLGDSALNIDKDMIDTIRKDSDAAIFFSRPEGLLAFDDNDIDLIGSIEEQFKARGMDKWFALLFNHTGDISEDIRENGDKCKLYHEHVINLGTPAVLNKIVDAADPEAVREEFLIPLLEKLTENMHDIDALILDSVKTDAEEVWNTYNILCTGMEKIVSGSVSGENNFLAVYNLLNKTKDNLMGALKAMNMQYAQQRSQICEVLSQRTKAVVSGIDGMLPDADAIAKKVADSGAAMPSAVYTDCLNELRLEITEKFIEIDTSLDKLVKEFKSKLIHVLADKNCGMLGEIVPLPEDGEDCEWLAVFMDEKLNSDNFKQLKLAFAFLYDFNLSVRGQLMNRVRSSLYEISSRNPNLLKGLDFHNYEKSILFNLKVSMKKIKDNLTKSLADFHMFPNEALFAVCDEFYDRISSTGAVEEEWIRLYSDNGMRIWKDELAKQAKNQEAYSAWNDVIEELNKYSEKHNFIVK